MITGLRINCVIVQGCNAETKKYEFNDLSEMYPNKNPIRLGRDTNCQIQIPDVMDVASRIHGMIFFNEGRIYYTDGSKNGTELLNGKNFSIVKGKTIELTNGQTLLVKQSIRGLLYLFYLVPFIRTK